MITREVCFTDQLHRELHKLAMEEYEGSEEQRREMKICAPGMERHVRNSPPMDALIEGLLWDALGRRS